MENAILETASRAAQLAILELDFGRARAEGVLTLGEALGARGLAVYEAREGNSSSGQGFAPVAAWPEGKAWPEVEGGAAERLAEVLIGQPHVEAAGGLRRLAFPEDVGGAQVFFPLLAFGRLTGFIAAALPENPSPEAVSALASWALSLSAAGARAGAEKAALRARAEEDAARRASSLLLARAGHELRTPLVALDGIASILEEKGDGMDPARRREAIRLVRQGGARLLRLVEEVLILSRIDSGVRQPEVGVLDFQAIARQAEALMAGLLASRGAGGPAFKAELDGDLPEGFASDAHAIMEMLENLLGNAVKFSARGTILLRIERAGEGRDSGAAGEMPRVTFTVSDEGSGMDAATLAAIAEPFHPTRPGLGGERGSGLGLTIVSSLARHVGGDFSLRSEKGRGTEARISLPSFSPDSRLSAPQVPGSA